MNIIRGTIYFQENSDIHRIVNETGSVRTT